MKRLLAYALTLVVMCDVAGAQPVHVAWRPPTGCTNTQVIQWSSSTSRWTCGSVTTLSGLTTNTITKATSASTIGDSTLTAGVESVDTIRALKSSSIATLMVGDNPDLTTNAQNGWKVQAFSNGNNYLDTKTASAGSTIFRSGHGTEEGFTRTWLTVLNSSGATTFAALLTATAGVTTPANLTTTGTGDVVSADDLSVGDDSNLGDDATDILDVNGDLSKFGSSLTDGDTYIYRNQINAGYASDVDDVALRFNYVGYALGGTRFRDTEFLDGKGAQACFIDGSAKTLNCVGGLQENGTAVLSGAITDNYFPIGSSGNLANSLMSQATAGGGSVMTNGNEFHFENDQDVDNVAGYINFQSYNAGVTRFRDLIIADGKGATVATFDGSDKSLAVVGLAWVGNSAAPAGELFKIANESNSTTAADQGMTLNSNRSGAIFYWDTKLATGGLFVGRIGDGTSAGYTNNWLTVTGAGVVALPQSVSVGGTSGDLTAKNNVTIEDNLVAGDATSDSHTIYGAVVHLETVGTSIAVSHNSEIRDDTAFAIGVGGSIALTGKYNGAGNVAGAAIKAAKTNATDGNYSFDMVFGTQPNGGSITERMRISDSGNVGIGTDTTPDYLLDVQGTLNADTSLNVGGVILLSDASTSIGSTAIQIGNDSTDTTTLIGIIDATNSATRFTVGDFRGTVIEPTAITGTNNNYAPTGHATATTIVVSTSGNATITGLAGGAAGRVVNLCSYASHPITLVTESASSTAANRFVFADSIDRNFLLNSAGCIALQWRSSDSRWHPIETNEFAKLHVNSNLVLYSDAHIVSAVGATGPTLSSCGTSPTVQGSDTAGVVTVGTGTVTSCTVTFATAFTTNEPSCVVTSEANNANPLYFSAKSTSAFTVTTSAGTNLASQQFDYHCIGTTIGTYAEGL